MFEYRWVEVELGDDRALCSLGREGWDAVSSTLIGEHFGRKIVGVLLKRAAGPRSIDLTTHDATVSAHPAAAVG